MTSKDTGSQTAYFKYAGVGIQFAGTFLVLGAVGWWLDGKLGTEPWLLVTGSLLGMGAGTYLLVKETGRISS